MSRFSVEINEKSELILSTKGRSSPVFKEIKDNFVDYAKQAGSGLVIGEQSLDGALITFTFNKEVSQTVEKLITHLTIVNREKYVNVDGNLIPTVTHDCLATIIGQLSKILTVTAPPPSYEEATRAAAAPPPPPPGPPPAALVSDSALFKAAREDVSQANPSAAKKENDDESFKSGM